MSHHSETLPPALLDYDTAAAILGCSPRMVRKLVETRQLDSVKVGRLVRVEPDALDRYIERHRRPATESGGGHAS
jgi:excisionase family DNA binding protein